MSSGCCCCFVGHQCCSYSPLVCPLLVRGTLAFRHLAPPHAVPYPPPLGLPADPLRQRSQVWDLQAYRTRVLGALPLKTHRGRVSSWHPELHQEHAVVLDKLDVLPSGIVGDVRSTGGEADRVSRLNQPTHGHKWLVNVAHLCGQSSTASLSGVPYEALLAQVWHTVAVGDFLLYTPS